MKSKHNRILTVILSVCLIVNLLPPPVFAADGDATSSLPATPSTSNNKANIYIYLDDVWTCIGTIDFTVSSSGNRNYIPTLTTSDVTTLVNQYLISDHALDTNGFKLRYANNTGFTSSTGYATIGNNSTTLGTQRNSSTANAAKYIRLMDTTSTTSNHVPLSFYTVTIDHPTEVDTVQIVPSGATITLPDGLLWSDGETTYTGGTSVTITGPITFTGSQSTCTITCTNGDSVTTDTVDFGSTYTLPKLDSDYNWVCNGTTYAGGTEITVQGNMNFVATERAKETRNIYYNVNFPTGSTGFYGTSFPSSPTLTGTDAATTTTDTVTESNTAAIRDVSDRMPVTTSSTHGASFQLAIRFAGWQTENDAIINPNATLTWAELLAYDFNGDGQITLTGQWEYGTGNTVNFCVRYDSKTGQSDTSTSRYTPSLFSTYVGGDGTLTLNGVTDEEAYQADQQIRALYGNWNGDLWLLEFPSDAYIFDQLKKHVSNLTVNDQAVDVNNLNSSTYAIRWYAFKEDGSDGWHVDGRLVERKGQITVSKAFYGDESALTSTESGFYIVASNGTRADDGTFTAYAPSDTNFKQHVLVLNDETADTLADTYPNAAFQSYDAATSSTASHTYQWEIDDISLGEQWQLVEYPTEVDGYTYYAEHSVYDTDGQVTSLAESGCTADVEGKTFLLDEDPDQGLLVEFSNFYYPKDSIFIKKEDGNTGAPLSGASFTMYQRGSDGELTQMKFNYDSATGQYICDPAGSLSEITTSSAGYTTISTTGFSYALGDVILEESSTPAGYDPAPSVTLTSKDGIVSISDISHGSNSAVDPSNWSHYAELEENGSVLVIKNYSTSHTSVTINKIWADNSTADNVTVVLQANGHIATNTFPGMTDAEVVISATTNWTHTWADLPVYANGELVDWSVKETKIGDEITLSDGISFANWTVVYSPAILTDADNNGLAENRLYTITNTVRRTQLFLTKTDLSGTTPLAGAAFSLSAVEWSDGSWFSANGATTYTGVSDANGLVRFDNLIAGTYYQLTETAAPSGYTIGQTSIVLTLDSAGQIMEVVDGTVSGTTLAGSYHAYTAPYNISVKNILQYNCSISAPDSITFTFSGTEHLIWNPETATYDSDVTGSWSESSSIQVTNQSGADVQLIVEAAVEYTAEHDSFPDLSLVLSCPSSGFSTTESDGRTVLSGELPKSDTCVITPGILGTPPDTAFPTPIRIGTLTIHVYLPP